MKSAESPAVWLDAGFIAETDARISPLDRGFLYGDGLFETMRAEDGKVLRLDLHLRRLGAGLEALRIRLNGVQEETWAPITNALLVKNGLGRRTASVKAVVSRGIVGGLGFPAAEKPTLLIRAEGYEPPAPEVYARGWSLHVTAGGFPHATARHKSLSYLRLLAARQEAVDAGAEEALLVDPEGLVVETAAGSILALTQGGWVRTSHPGQLAGITAGVVAGLLEGRGPGAAVRPMHLRELTAARAVWVLNSLMGIMPVRSIDSAALPETAADLAALLRTQLFKPQG
jgi:branched-chain amino acid aminotransferase